MLILIAVLVSLGSAQFIPSYLAPGERPMKRPFPGSMSMRLQKNSQFRNVPVEHSLDAGMVQSYINSPIMDQDGECEPMPNRTQYRPAFFQCSEDTPLTLHGGAVTNARGDDNYPVVFRGPIRIFLDVSSDARRRYDDLGVEVSLYKRSTGWFGCGWMFLPSFGMLSNHDMCYDNPSCPLSPGRQVIEFTIDPSHLFTRLFRMIHHDMSSYQLVVRLRDNRNPFVDLLCATIQMRIKM